MINQEIFERQAKELAAMKVMQLAMPPDKGYMLAAVVQAAAICLDLPEATQAFCKQFVNGFCDRYRDQMPTVVKAIEDAWQDRNPITEDDRDPSEKPCPCGEGTTTLRDCDGRPCGFYRTCEDIPMCPPEISKELGYEEDDDYITIITRKDDDHT